MGLDLKSYDEIESDFHRLTSVETSPNLSVLALLLPLALSLTFSFLNPIEHESLA